MAKRKLSEISEQEKKTLFKKAIPEAKKWLARMKKNHEEVKANYQSLISEMEKDPTNKAMLKSWQLWRLKRNIEATERAIANYEKAIVSTSYDHYIEAMRDVITELFDVPGISDESESAVKNEYEMFAEIFTLGIEAAKRAIRKK